jgi:hypothetical protein
MQAINSDVNFSALSIVSRFLLKLDAGSPDDGRPFSRSQVFGYAQA